MGSKAVRLTMSTCFPVCSQSGRVVHPRTLASLQRCCRVALLGPGAHDVALEVELYSLARWRARAAARSSRMASRTSVRDCPGPRQLAPEGCRPRCVRAALGSPSASRIRTAHSIAMILVRGLTYWRTLALPEVNQSSCDPTRPSNQE